MRYPPDWSNDSRAASASLRRDDFDFQQRAGCDQRSDLDRAACRLVRLFLGSEELAVAGHQSGKIEFIVIGRIGGQGYSHFHDVAHPETELGKRALDLW